MDNFTFGGKTLECLTEKEKKTAKMNRTLAFLKTKSAPRRGGGGGGTPGNSWLGSAAMFSNS